MPKQLGAGSKTTKADLVAALKESFEMCDAAYDGITEANMNDPIQSFRGPDSAAVAALWFNVAHDEECYGSMAVYLRLQKLVPPSSQGAAVAWARAKGSSSGSYSHSMVAGGLFVRS